MGREYKKNNFITMANAPKPLDNPTIIKTIEEAIANETTYAELVTLIDKLPNTRYVTMKFMK